MNTPYLKLYMNWQNALGYVSSLSYFVMNHFETITGVILSLVMIISSLVVQWYKIKSLKNDERRREEKHQQDMMQEDQVHQLNLKKNATENHQG